MVRFSGCVARSDSSTCGFEKSKGKLDRFDRSTRRSGNLTRRLHYFMNIPDRIDRFPAGLPNLRISLVDLRLEWIDQMNLRVDLINWELDSK